MPTTCEEAHGFSGCCSADGKTAYYWSGNEILSVTCAGTAVCSWTSASGGYYDCNAGPAKADPSGTFPLLCSSPVDPADTGCDEVLCTTNADCAGTPGTPACDVQTGACVACMSDFDCKATGTPSCNTSTNTCVANTQCTDADLTENADDGPVGATDITPTNGNTSSTTGHSICGLPAYESDYFKFTASNGDNVTLSLAWTDATKDLDITVLGASGETLGLDFYLRPAVVELKFLPAGTYYVRVTRYDGTLAAASTPYTLAFSRTVGNKCTSFADCAAYSTSSLLRGTCTAAGTCANIDGKGAVAANGVCDSADDCTSGTCALTPFLENNAEFAICSKDCTADAQCGANQVCTSLFDPNFCRPRCTKDTECPVDFSATPASGPWKYRTCNVATGKCAP
ncbi:MAG: hypothetical protein EOO74_08265 [Myxococcales bacterium]|nr:MAG: hypothetical protein EOO74_08265 [Myxococcales bacterium]